MICERCGLAPRQDHRPVVRRLLRHRGGGAGRCRDGRRAHPGAETAGLPLIGIAETVGCSSRTLIDIVHGRRRTTRQWIADGVLAIPLSDGCAVCDDVATAAMSQRPERDRRAGRQVGRRERHFYRHGRPELARMFAATTERRH